MTLGQMNSKLMKAQEAETHLDRALICRALLEDAVDFIYSKAGVKKPPKASLLELIDSPVVTGYINDADTINSLHYVLHSPHECQTWQKRSQKGSQARL